MRSANEISTRHLAGKTHPLLLLGIACLAAVVIGAFLFLLPSEDQEGFIQAESTLPVSTADDSESQGHLAALNEESPSVSVESGASTSLDEPTPETASSLDQSRTARVQVVDWRGEPVAGAQIAFARKLPAFYAGGDQGNPFSPEEMAGLDPAMMEMMGMMDPEMMMMMGLDPAMMGMEMDQDIEMMMMGMDVDWAGQLNGQGHQVSDEEGYFELVADPGETIGVAVFSSRGYVRTILTDVRPDSDTRITLDRLAAISGSVQDAEGNPISEGMVTIDYSGIGGRLAEMFGISDGERQVALSEDGTYRIGQALPVSVEVHLELDSPSIYAPAESVQIDLEGKDEESDVDFVLHVGGVLDGVVTDERGEPISEVFLVAGYSGTPSSWRYPRGTTDADGYYRLVGLAVDQPISSLAALKEGYEAPSRRDVRPSEGPQNFVLQRLHGLRVLAIRSDTGEPVKNYFVRGARISEPGGELMTQFYGLANSIDEGGYAEIEDLIHGAFVLEAHEIRQEALDDLDGDEEVEHWNDVMTGLVGRKEVVVAEVRDGVVVIELDVGHTLRGRFRSDRPGIGAMDGNVVLTAKEPYRLYYDESASDHGWFAKADIGGRFQITGVLPGEYLLFSEMPDGRRTDSPIKVVIPEDERSAEVVIDVYENASLRGRLVRPDGTGIGGYMVSLTADGLPQPGDRGRYQYSSEYDAETDDEGRFRFRDLPAGDVRLIVQDLLRDNRVTKELTLASGEDRYVELVLDKRIHVQGTIELGPGYSADSISSLVFTPLEFYSSAGEEATSDWNLDWFSVQLEGHDDAIVHYAENLLPGRYVLSAGMRSFAPSIGIALIEVQMEPEEQNVHSTMNAAPAELVLTSASGAPIYIPWHSALRFDFRQPASSEVLASSELSLDRPYVQIPLLAVGEYRVSLGMAGRVLTSEWTSVSMGAENVIEFVLP